MKELTPDSIGIRRKGDPTIRINKKSGQLQFSAGAVRRLGLKLGDKVSFIVDEAAKKVYISQTPDGFVTKNYKPELLLIQSISLATQIISCTGKTEISIKFLVAIKDKIEGRTMNELIPMR
jgi:hypothetical protein